MAALTVVFLLVLYIVVVECVIMVVCRSFQANLNYYRLLSKVQPRVSRSGSDAVSFVITALINAQYYYL